MNLNRKIKQIAGFALLRISISITVLFLAIFLYILFSRGLPVLSWEFLTAAPRKFMTAGGIFPAIVGTLYLTLLSVTIALPFGVLTAIYLTTYASPKWLVRVIRIANNTLAGVPSIIFGLFGMAIFVQLFKFDVSILSGSLTLAVLILPVIINASEEAIKQVPDDFRSASLALGATESQTLFRIILPAAFPNILTGTIISIGRVAGETAPILFTAATFYTRKLPGSIFDEVMALPYHIYALLTEGIHPEEQVPIAYGTAVTLLLLVLSITLAAIIIRYNIRKKKKW